MKEVNVHTHSASAVDVEVASIKISLKRKAQESLEVPSTIINGCIENSSQSAQGSLPNSQALKKVIRRKRIQINSVPPNPTNSRELVIPEDYKKICDEQR